MGNKGTSLPMGGKLESDDYITSPSGRYIALMQSDGNLVIYRGTMLTPDHAIWDSHSYGGPTGLHCALMQTDGNFVIYQGETLTPEHAIWATHTQFSSGTDFVLRLEDDGTLYIENDQNTILWFSIHNPLLVGRKMLEGDRKRKERTEGPGQERDPPLLGEVSTQWLSVDWRNVTIGTAENKDVKLSSDDRTTGTVLLGGTGTGKTSLLEHLAIADLQAGITNIIFDPHGEIGERLLRLGADIASDHILFCEITGNLSYGFNPLEVNDPNDPLEVSRTVDSLLQVFRKHWSSNNAYAFGSTVEWVLSNTARTIIANSPNYTLAEIPLLLRDRDFRQKLVAKVQNPQVLEFWARIRQLDNNQKPRDLWEEIRSTTTRLSQFLANEWLYRVLYQAKGTVNFSKLIDSGKTIIFSLPIGKLGEEPASLLGSLLLGKLVTTIFNREVYGSVPPRVHIYIDEFSRFCTPLVSSALFAQSRKFNVGATITLQTLSQIGDEESRTAILQAGNHLLFRTIGSDAKTLAAQMPLPDPAGLMKPEPILVYSPQPVNDIWHRGHPNQIVMNVRERYFWIVDAVEKMGKDSWWEYGLGELFRLFPEWEEPEPDPFTHKFYQEYLFPDLQNYRAHTGMLHNAIAPMNEYYFAWMNHEFVPVAKTVDERQFDMLTSIIMPLIGVWGIRPIVDKMEQKEWKKYLAAKSQRYAVSPREQEQLETWALIPISDDETDAIINLIKFVLLMRSINEAYEPGWDMKVLRDYANARIPELKKVLHDRYNPNRSLTERQLRAVIDRAEWETLNLWNAVASLTVCGYFLEKEPVSVQSHSYKDVELYRRTYSDVRDELTTKLVSLPPYQAICSLVSNAGELPVQIKTLPPLHIQASSSLEAQVKAIRERCQKELGHPWQEVYREMQTRQNLPPAKSHIPQQKP